MTAQYLWVKMASATRIIETGGSNNMNPNPRTDRQSERGAGLAEYALLLTLIAVVCIAAVTGLGTAVATALGNAAAIF